MLLIWRYPGESREEGLSITLDRGAQYASVEFGARIRGAGILPSMGSRGDAYDNAMAESFVATIKKELIHREPWPTRGGGTECDLRVHRVLLQSSSQAFSSRVSESL